MWRRILRTWDDDRPRLGIRQSAGLGVALLIVGGPRYAPVVLVTHLITSLTLNQPLTAATWTAIIIPFVATASYVAMAEIVRGRLGNAPIPRNRRDAFLLVAASSQPRFRGALAASFLVPSSVHDSQGAFWLSFLYRWLGGTGSILTIVPFVSVHVAPWIQAKRPVAARIPRPHGKAEAAIQAAALLGAFLLIHELEPLRTLRAFLICAAPLAWISSAGACGGRPWRPSSSTWALTSQSASQEAPRPISSISCSFRSRTPPSAWASEPL